MLRASLVLASLTAFIASPALAAAPTSLAFEGVLTTSGGTPATDGSYAITFSLYTSQTEKSPFWQEGPSQVVVKKGSFATALGLTKPLNATKLAAAKSAWLGIKVGTDPELTRQPLRSVAYALVAARAAALSCTGCVSGGQLANGGIAASKVGFAYAGSATKGGPAKDLACTGCVSVKEMKFDGDLSLGGNSLKAKNGSFTGGVSAATVTATQFLGDGSKLSGIKIPSGQCAKVGEVVKGINADGSLKCVAAMDPDALPKDGLNEISNDLLSNQFIDTVSATNKNVAIPDNQGSSATSNVVFPDIGTTQTFAVKVHVESTDLSNLRLTILPPDDKKVGWVLCDPCGKKDAKILKATYTPKNKPKSGDIGKWVGANAKGLWNLKALDTGFCVPQAAGNAKYCNITKKTDGWIADWSIVVQTLSNKKVEAKGLLITSGGLQLKKSDTHPVTCTAERFGYLYANPKDKAIYVCNGKEFSSISLNNKGTENNPVVSCMVLKTLSPSSKSGFYWIDPDGPTGSETSFRTWCDQETNGGGWTLAIRGTMDKGYNNSLNKEITASNGFMRSFNRSNFKDILVKLGDYKLQKDWSAFHNVGNGNQTLDARIKNCCSGSYSVDYNVDLKYKAAARSASQANVAEMEALSLRMSQTSGPNDAMFFVVGRQSRTACNYYNNNRYVSHSCIGVQLGFGTSNYTWGSWTTRTDWKTTCGYAGYRSTTSTSSCSSSGAVFIR